MNIKKSNHEEIGVGFCPDAVILVSIDSLKNSLLATVTGKLKYWVELKIIKKTFHDSYEI